MATYTLTGPSSGVQQIASSNFTVTMDATAIVGTVRVTPSDGNKGGSFSPAFLDFTTANQAKTFTYTPQNTGSVTISTTNNQSYVNPVGVAYLVTLNKDVAINQILYAQFKNRGTRFPLEEIVRDGGMREADALTLRDAFAAYYQTKQNRPALTPAHPDVAANIHTTSQFGRSGRGGSARQSGDTPGDTTTQTGR